MKEGNFILIRFLRILLYTTPCGIQNVELILDASLREKNMKPSCSTNVVTWQENGQHRVSNMNYMFLGNFNTKYSNQAVLLKSNIHSK